LYTQALTADAPLALVPDAPAAEGDGDAVG
jgi:hypothetical protein